MTKQRAVLILVACSAIWGASFTLNKMALVAISPLLLMGIRFAAAATMLGGVYRKVTAEDWKAGTLLGTLFAIQIALFITGLDRIPSNRAAFLFSVCTALVPLMVVAVNRRRPTARQVLAVGLAMAGTWWLTDPRGSGSGLRTGDLLMLGSAVCGAAYVVAAGYWAPRHDPLRLLGVQLAVMAVLGFAFMLVLERPRFEPSTGIVLLVIFLALSSIATFGGQLVGQRLIRPTEAAVIYALEPVTAALAGYVALGEGLRGSEWLGAALILAAAGTAVGGPAGGADGGSAASPT